VLFEALRSLLCARRAALAASLALCALALSACVQPTIPATPRGPQAAMPAYVPPPPVVRPPPPSPPAPPIAYDGGKIKVGLLLPLSGANADLGKGMLDAAQLALFDAGDTQVQLLPRDTRGTPEGAADAARQVVAEGARLIIGPLLAGEVEAVKPAARTGGVAVLAFSTSTQLAGDGTYLLGFLPRQEVERVVSFAHARGLGRFAVLAPRSAYGEVAVGALRDAVAVDGASLGKVAFYPPAATDVASPAKDMAAGADFDALLLPVNAARLKGLASALVVKFLGTGVWDEPGLGAEPALIGAWFAGPAPTARADFERRFASFYQHAPPRLATLAYDATALATTLARNPRGPDFSAAALTVPAGFIGLDGVFRFLPSGLIQRGLAVLEVRPEGTVVVDPSPQSLDGAAY
jgi:branched-chain amino acid transport system substrate-binding protein